MPLDKILGLRRQLVSKEAGHGRVARDMLLVMSFLLVAKFAGAIKEMVIAWRYGTSEIVDAYLFMTNIVGVPIVVWYGVISVLFIPAAVRLKAEGAGGYRRFSAEAFGISLAAAFVASAAALLFFEVLFSAGISGLAPTTARLARGSILWFLPLIPLGFVAHYCSVVLMSNRSQANTALEAVPPIALLIMMSAVPFVEVGPLLWGTLLGALMHAVLSLTVARRSGLLERPSCSFHSPAWRVVGAGVGAMLAAQVLQSLTAVADQFFAAQLGPGSISTLGYANRVLALFLTLGTTAIGRAALPVFSELGHRSFDELRAATIRWTYILFCLGVLFGLGAYCSAEIIIRLLFERGSFNQNDTTLVVSIFRYGLLQAPFYFAAMVLSQALFSAGRYRLVALVSALNLFAKLLASFILVPLFGLSGLMMATAAMYLISCAAYGIILRRLVKVK